MASTGTENNITLGTPIGLFVANQDVKKADYDPFKHIPRPGHADYTYLAKYGIKSESGGGKTFTVYRIGYTYRKIVSEGDDLQSGSWSYSSKGPKGESRN